MRLYHFTSQRFGLLALQNRRLKIARVSELNDPFEFLGWKLQDAGTRERLQRWKEDRNAQLGILCFSKKWSNPLLWGHYADKHRGLVLGFDTPDDGTYNPVKYRRSRLPNPTGRELGDGDFDDLLLTKFTAWRYETEYRCFCLFKDSVVENGLNFEPFSSSMKLAEVIVGDQATVTRAELGTALGDQAVAVTSFKARPAFGTFSVVRNRNASLWK